MKKIFALIFGLLVICSTLASVSAVDMGNKNFGIQNSKTANSRYLNLPVYIFGDKNLKISSYNTHIIDNLTKISKSKKCIVIIEKSPNIEDSKVLEDMLRNGNVIITTKNSYKIVDRLVSKIVGSKKSVVKIYYSNGTGKVIENKIYIYRILPSKLKGKKYCIHVYGFAGENISDKVIKKATEMLYYPLTSNDWNYVDTIYWSSGDWAKPYGRLNIEHVIMQNPNNPSYKCVRATTQIISGEKLGWQSNGWVYDNYELKNYYNLNYEGRGNKLIDYDPGDIDNTIPSISVSLGYPPSLSISWSYPGDHIYRIIDDSDFSKDTACWEHIFHCWYNNYGTSATIKVEPGFEYRHYGSAEQLWKITGKWLGHWYFVREAEPQYLTVYIYYNG